MSIEIQERLERVKGEDIVSTTIQQVEESSAQLLELREGIIVEDKVYIKPFNTYREKVERIILQVQNFLSYFKKESREELELIEKLNQIRTKLEAITNKIGDAKTEWVKIKGLSYVRRDIQDISDQKLTDIILLLKEVERNEIRNKIIEREGNETRQRRDIEKDKREIEELKVVLVGDKDKIKEKDKTIRMELDLREKFKSESELRRTKDPESWKNIQEKIIAILEGNIQKYQDLTQDLRYLDTKLLNSLAIFAIENNEKGLFSSLLERIDVNFKNSEDLSLLTLSAKIPDGYIFSQILTKPDLDLDDLVFYTVVSLKDEKKIQFLLEGQHISIKGNKHANCYEKPHFLHFNQSSLRNGDYYKSYVFNGKELTYFDRKGRSQEIKLKNRTQEELESLIKKILKDKTTKQLAGNELTQLMIFCKNHFHKSGYSALMTSIRNNPDEISPITKMLIEELKEANAQLAINYVYQNQTALSIAVVNGNSELCSLLLKAGAGIEVGVGYLDVLQIAYEKGHIEVVEVLRGNPQVKLKYSKDETTKLLITYKAFYAVDTNDLTLFDKALKEVTHFDAKNTQGYTLLQWCILNKKDEMLEKLLRRIEENKIDINQESENLARKTALFLAVMTGNKELCQTLLSLNANVDCYIYGRYYSYPGLIKYVSKKESALMWAIKNDFTEIAQLLLEYIPNQSPVLDYMCFDKSALYYATQRENYPICKLLIEKGANLDLGASSLALAIENNLINIIALLKEHGCKEDKLYLAFNALNNEDIPSFENYLNDRDIDLNGMDSEGYTLLHRAVLKKSIQLCKLLLDKQVDVNQVCERSNINEYNKSALFFSVEQGSYKIFSLLLKYDANLNCSDFYGNSLLTCAVKKYVALSVNIKDSIKDKWLSICKQLIHACKEKDISLLNKFDQDGKTALYIAAENGCVELCEELISTGANTSLGITNNLGVVTTPLNIAIEKKHLEIIQLLDLSQESLSNSYTF